MRLFLVVTFFCACCLMGISQTIKQLETKLDSLYKLEGVVISQLEKLKLEQIIVDLKRIGYPTGVEVEIAEHQAMVLGYDEVHEQARWVAHVIMPDIERGNVSRTNDFREDPFVTTGTSVKADYWFSGYDRGHLAPSADFRWSQVALSESYFYSNMAPQLPELNRNKMAELENLLRSYVLSNKEKLYVITGSVLSDDLPKMKNEGRKNEVSIPNLFYKAVLDYSGDEKRGIAFLLPNKNCPNPLLMYAVTIDSVEAITGLNFFNQLSDEEQNKLESTKNVDLWRTKAMQGEVLPINPTTLPKGKINTVQAQYFIGNKARVCGTVVSVKYSERSGATFLNLDKKFPNQIFSVTIWKEDRANFSYVPKIELIGVNVCIKGVIENNKGTPTINVKNEKSIEIIEN